jgi:peptidoglycan/xylan/chitin deacetylase (PgdA/CDA1 family)
MKFLRTFSLGIVACALLAIGGCILLPSVVQKVNPNVTYRIPGVGKTLYLTLDDGPSEATPLILDVLKRYNIPATFFVITDHIRPDLMNRIVSDGHQIAHHMRTSASIQKMPPDRFRTEFLEADSALAAYPGVKLFRPPNGSVSAEQAAFVTAQGYQIVVGTIFPLDHWLENKTAITTLAKLLITDGGIIILHDTRERGPRTAAVLDELIPYLKQKGYKFSLLPKKKA